MKATAARLTEHGKPLDVVIDSLLPLSQVNEAFARLESRKANGKLVLDLRS